ncbi:hypothetical protein EV715DRAFT_293221 [Schizophyllum commune]
MLSSSVLRVHPRRAAFLYHNYGTPVAAHYSIAVLHIYRHWDLNKKLAHVPQWFIDSPGMDEDDLTVSSREGDGYTVTSDSNYHAEHVVYDDEEELQARVSEWAKVVDPDSVPEEQPPILPEPIEVRRSERLRRRYNPYGKPEPVYRPDPVREAPWPLPEDADPFSYPPAWTKRAIRFPTRKFSSNDWAYFGYNVGLATSRRK